MAHPERSQGEHRRALSARFRTTFDVIKGARFVTAFAATLLWLTPAPAVSAQSATSPPVRMNCALLSAAEYAFCQSLEAEDCDLARPAQYLFCKGLVERDCSLTQRSDKRTCRALVDRDCNLAGRAGYWICRGLTEDCSVAPDEDRTFCLATSAFFRRSH